MKNSGTMHIDARVDYKDESDLMATDAAELREQHQNQLDLLEKLAEAAGTIASLKAQLAEAQKVPDDAVIERDFVYDSSTKLHTPKVTIYFKAVDAQAKGAFDERDKFAAMLSAAPTYKKED